ncbi:DNA polymerase III subunit gamma/tau [Collinsella sp. AGMB00827]|uniref:DNA polymerase III subunit gamma/tau n=1 Tax=Collinsella ureilytica TaxID=2869515 RepID=A0ABS7MJY8_9ACTN|nr:DNA polymerase III subunit gamma/tau [Collinsella urealyticum]MBY4797597.1 DNA polymerase III subunit gamma/tau [Collinsella urealyticum]
MESLYRKYRPLTFESVVGQEHIVSTLENAVTEQRLSHAYLFCGPRGTGKTTLARILAKALLCERASARPDGHIGALPDGTCPECEAIAEGTHPDVYELDAASRTGVDSVREEIVNSVGFAPVRGARKVYIIDEVHMLTTAAFNALLKTIEEPPSHVVFVLCTTDPQKVPETILSRCQRFDFHRISEDGLVNRMRWICEREGFAFDDQALEIVANHARGGMRDALSTLEQLSVFGNGAVRAADARALLGETERRVLAQIAVGIAKRDVVGLFGAVREQADAGVDLMELTRDLVTHLRDVYTVKLAGPVPAIVDGTPEELAGLVAEADQFEHADRLSRALLVLDDAALSMRDAADLRIVLEIALTRLARPESDLTLEALAERVAKLEAQIARGIPSAPTDPERLVGQAEQQRAQRGGATAVAQSGATRESASAQGVAELPRADYAAAEPAELPHAGGAESMAAAAQRQPSQAPTSAPSPAQPAASSPASVERPTQPVAAFPATVVQPPSASPGARPEACVVDAGELQRKWAEAVKLITAAQASRGALLQRSHAQSDDGSRLVITLPKGSGFALKMLAQPDSGAVIAPVVAEVFGSRAIEYRMEGDSAAGGSAVVQPQPAPAAHAASVPSRPVASRVASSDRPAAAASESVSVGAGAAPSAAAEVTGTVPAVQTAAPSAAPSALPSPEAQASAGHASVPQASAAPSSPAGHASAVQPPAAHSPAAHTPVPQAPAVQASAAQPSTAPAQSAQPGSATDFDVDDAKSVLGDVFGAGVIFKDE